MSNHALLGPFAATCEALDDPSDLSLLTELRDGNDAAAENCCISATPSD